MKAQEIARLLGIDLATAIAGPFAYRAKADPRQLVGLGLALPQARVQFQQAYEAKAIDPADLYLLGQSQPEEEGSSSAPLGAEE